MIENNTNYCSVEQHFLYNHRYDTYQPYQFKLFNAFVLIQSCSKPYVYITDINLVIMSCAYI